LNQFYKQMVGFAVLILVLLSVFTFWSGQPTPETKNWEYSVLLDEIEQGRVKDLQVRGQEIQGTTRSGERFRSDGPPDYGHLVQLLAENKDKVKFEFVRDGDSLWQTFFIQWLPLLFFLGIFILLFRQLQSGGGRAMNFGKARARLLSESQQRFTFADVAGVDEAKGELEEIVEFLRDPKKFTRLGGRIPKGVLLIGPPGTGKTLLARAIAGEAGVPFFSISGSDFVEMFVGVGASRVRDLFGQGKKNAPCIIFVDEIDAVGRHRGAGLGGGHDEREQTLNQLLVEMDGFESSEGVIIIAATNRPDVLDPAMLRPGRFDRHVVVSLPDLRGREAILRVHSRRVLLDQAVDLSVIARGTPGFSGADLENLINEGALLAARRTADAVTLHDLELAKDKVLMGSERRSLMLSAKERRVTAYHEGGHALVAMLAQHGDPVHKVTMIPRGRALGVTMTMPTEDRHMRTKDELIANLNYAMGGRAAEELVFGQFSTGASNDLKQATDIAYDMVCSYGMSEKLGPVFLGGDDSTVFLGREFGHAPRFGAARRKEIDDEVTRLLTEAYEHAKRLLGEQREALDRIAKSLLERETLDVAELRMLIEGRALPPLELPNKVAASPKRKREIEDSAADREDAPFRGKGIPDPEPIPG
jgi:cell division protease FtsH